MKTFKLTDWIISLGLMVFFLLAALARVPRIINYAYVVTAGWQLLSMIVHAYNGWFTRKGGIRLGYHWLVTGLILMSLSCIFLPYFFFVMIITLLTAPFLAAFYTWMCFEEWQRLSRRPLAVLK